MNGVLLFIFCYAVGSIPFGIIVARMKNVDITKTGSGNIGATNVLRALGPGYGALVLFLDALKGFVPAFIGQHTPPPHGAGSSVTAIPVVCGLLAILGHLYPVFLKFKGGKGVATSLGVLVALDARAAFLAFWVWLIPVVLTRYVSLGSLCASVFVPAYFIATGKPFSYKVFAVLCAIFVIVKHRENIKRLRERKENKISL